MAVKTFTSEILTSSDTNTYLANSGLVWVAGAAFGSASSVTVSNCFNNTYDHYRITVTANASANTNFNWQMVSASGTDSSANYWRRTVYVQAAAAASNSDSDTKWYIGEPSSTTAATTSVVFDLYSPNLATYTTVLGSAYGYNTPSLMTGGWGLKTSTQYTGLTFAPGTGTTTGTITIYGYRKS